MTLAVTCRLLAAGARLVFTSPRGTVFETVDGERVETDMRADESTF